MFQAQEPKNFFKKSTFLTLVSSPNLKKVYELQVIQKKSATFDEEQALPIYCIVSKTKLK